MKGIAFSAIGIPVLVSALGCSAGGSHRPAVFETSLGPRLAALIDAHGGYSRWSRYAGARFHYRATLADGAAMEARVLLVFSAPAAIWVEEPGGEGDASWSAVSLEKISGAGLPDVIPGFRSGSEPAPAPAEAHFSLLSLRNTFALPFVLACEGWSFRTLMAPPSHAVDTSDEIQAVPPAGSEHLGPYLIKNASVGESGLLDRLYYASSHPGSSGGAYELRLEGFRIVDGMTVATRQTHYLRMPASREPKTVADPLRLAPREATTAMEPFLEQRTEDVDFLSRSEIEELLEETLDS